MSDVQELSALKLIFSELMKHDEEVKSFFLTRSVKWPSFILRQTEDDFNENDLERHSLLSARVENCSLKGFQIDV